MHWNPRVTASVEPNLVSQAKLALLEDRTRVGCAHATDEPRASSETNEKDTDHLMSNLLKVGYKYWTTTGLVVMSSELEAM